jgi:DNA-3-methyladenine glycosylase
MYGPPGQVYIYFTYGIHWLLNFVTEDEEYPAAVLIRGIKPTEGLSIIGGRRKGHPSTGWTDGPAKICQALNLDGRFNGLDSCDPQAVLFVEDGEPIHAVDITKSPRVGLNNVPEPWKSIPWNFKIDNKVLSTG